MTQQDRLASTFAQYSDGVAVSGAGRWIHVSGQVGMDEEHTVVPGGLAAETEAAFDRIERVLAHFDADLSHVVKMTVFLTSLERYAEFAAVRAARFGDAVPASSAVQVAGLMLGAELEVDAVAFVPADR
jgi:2-iminobutanoate/2-iminopropanoate deaminase